MDHLRARAAGRRADGSRAREARIKFGSNAFFFQEGHAKDYAGARYGELRVSPSGELLVSGLRAADLKPLGIYSQR